jgi:hypothetical protein
MDETGPEKLAVESRAFQAQQPLLERKYPWKYVVFKGTSLIGAWSTLAEAEAAAAQRFRPGNYLVRLVRPGPKPDLA